MDIPASAPAVPVNVNDEPNTIRRRHHSAAAPAVSIPASEHEMQSAAASNSSNTDDLFLSSSYPFWVLSTHDQVKQFLLDDILHLYSYTALVRIAALEIFENDIVTRGDALVPFIRILMSILTFIPCLVIYLFGWYSFIMFMITWCVLSSVLTGLMHQLHPCVRLVLRHPSIHAEAKQPLETRCFDSSSCASLLSSAALENCESRVLVAPMSDEKITNGSRRTIRDQLDITLAMTRILIEQHERNAPDDMEAFRKTHLYLVEKLFEYYQSVVVFQPHVLAEAKRRNPRFWQFYGNILPFEKQ